MHHARMSQENTTKTSMESVVNCHAFSPKCKRGNNDVIVVDVEAELPPDDDVIPTQLDQVKVDPDAKDGLDYSCEGELEADRVMGKSYNEHCHQSPAGSCNWQECNLTGSSGSGDAVENDDHVTVGPTGLKSDDQRKLRGVVDDNADLPIIDSATALLPMSSVPEGLDYGTVATSATSETTSTSEPSSVLSDSASSTNWFEEITSEPGSISLPSIATPVTSLSEPIFVPSDSCASTPCLDDSSEGGGSKATEREQRYYIALETRNGTANYALIAVDDPKLVKAEQADDVDCWITSSMCTKMDVDDCSATMDMERDEEVQQSLGHSVTSAFDSQDTLNDVPQSGGHPSFDNSGGFCSNAELNLAGVDEPSRMAYRMLAPPPPHTSVQPATFPLKPLALKYTAAQNLSDFLPPPPNLCHAPPTAHAPMTTWCRPPTPYPHRLASATRVAQQPTNPTAQSGHDSFSLGLLGINSNSHPPMTSTPWLTNDQRRQPNAICTGGSPSLLNMSAANACSNSTGISSLTLNSSGEEMSSQSPDEYPRAPHNTPNTDYSSSAASVGVASPAVPPTASGVQQFQGCYQGVHFVNAHAPMVMKETHNEKERKRRNRIKNACSALRELVPGVTERTDKATVLECVAKYIYHMKQHVGPQFDKDFVGKCSATY